MKHQIYQHPFADLFWGDTGVIVEADITAAPDDVAFSLNNFGTCAGEQFNYGILKIGYRWNNTGDTFSLAGALGGEGWLVQTDESLKVYNRRGGIGETYQSDMMPFNFLRQDLTAFSDGVTSHALCIKTYIMDTGTDLYEFGPDNNSPDLRFNNAWPLTPGGGATIRARLFLGLRQPFPRT